MEEATDETSAGKERERERREERKRGPVGNRVPSLCEV